MNFRKKLLLALLLCPAVGLPQSAQIPAQFHGKWGGGLQWCDGEDDARLIVTANSVRFWESSGKVLEVRVISPLEIVIEVEARGEGEVSRGSLRFKLSEDKRTLTDITHESPQYHVSRVRCGPS